MNYIVGTFCGGISVILPGPSADAIFRGHSWRLKESDELIVIILRRFLYFGLEVILFFFLLGNLIASYIFEVQNVVL